MSKLLEKIKSFQKKYEIEYSHGPVSLKSKKKSKPKNSGNEMNLFHGIFFPFIFMESISLKISSNWFH